MASFLDQGFLSRIRRNHALEHATMTILSRRNPGYSMAGYSDMKGFWLVGNLPMEEISSAAVEALARLRNGEHALAVHPNCGTNFATAGMLAGSVAWLAMLNVDGGLKKRLERWPMLVTLVTLALIAAQPLGMLFQARVTTSAEPGGLQVAGILRETRGGMPVHRVLTRDE